MRYNLPFFPRRRLPPFFLHSAPLSSSILPAPELEGEGRRFPPPTQRPESPIRAPSRSGNPPLYFSLLFFTPRGSAGLLRLFLDPGMWGGRRALDSAAAPAAVVAIREIDGRWRYGAGERSVWFYSGVDREGGSFLLSFFLVIFGTGVFWGSLVCYCSC